MIEAKELVENVDNYMKALCYSYHCDQQGLFAAVAEHTQRYANRLAGLDPDRNR
jgi:hypothetical protein